MSFTKGCFIGQELVCRIDSRGHVNRFLRRVADIEGDWPPVGAEIVVDGKVVGALTSVAPAELPTGALGYVRREVEPPSAVELRWDGGAAPRRRPRYDGERHHEAGALGVDGLDAHVAAHRQRELAHDGETDAGAEGAARHRPRRVEPLEHARQVGGRDAGAVVVDVQLHAVADGRDADRDARRRELQRVLHQVGDDLREPLRVERRRHRRRRLDRERDADVGRRGTERLDCVAHHRARRRPAWGAARTGARRAGRGRADRRRAARAGVTPTR